MEDRGTCASCKHVFWCSPSEGVCTLLGAFDLVSLNTHSCGAYTYEEHPQFTEEKERKQP